MRRILTGIALLLASAAANAGAFDERLEAGHALLEQGDPEGALAVYRDLQTEAPESDLLYYSIGCAQYDKGMADAEAGAAEGALESLTDAEQAFEKVIASPNDVVRRRAHYNRANCLAQRAEQTLAAGQYEAAGKQFEQALAAYDEVLRLYPDHEDACHNRDRIRYLLKKMLQRPPEQDNEEEQQSQDGQQRQQDAQEEPKKEDGQQQQSEQGQEEQQQDGQAPDGSPPDDAQQEPGEQPREALEPRDLDRRNIEAILESLEEMDEHELHDTKSGRGGYVRGDWW